MPGYGELVARGAELVQWGALLLVIVAMAGATWVVEREATARRLMLITLLGASLWAYGLGINAERYTALVAVILVTQFVALAERRTNPGASS